VVPRSDLHPPVKMLTSPATALYIPNFSDLTGHCNHSKSNECLKEHPSYNWYELHWNDLHNGSPSL